MCAITDASSPDLCQPVRLRMRDRAAPIAIVRARLAIILKQSCCAVLLFQALFAFSASSLCQSAPTSEQIDQGREIYDESCQACHGRDIVNSGAVTFDLRKFRKDAFQRFRSAVLDGKGQGMPSFRDRIGDTDVDRLWAYVRGKP
jgi:mono/diheme cytochrome c family protein